MQFTANVGTTDRILRLVVGGLLCLLAAFGTIGIWGWIGLILVATAFMKFCPVYKILGLKTNADG